MITKKAKPDPAGPDYVLKPEERDPADRAFAKMIAKTAPRVKLQKNTIAIDHPNQLVGELLTMDAFGTGDRDFANGILTQLANASGLPGQLGDESNLNFMASVVVGIRPNDQVEAMIGAQMAVTHSAAMRAAQYLARSENLLETESAERTFNKLVRSFAALVEALKRHRAVDEQTMTVQNNVAVHDGGQAIVTQNAPAVPTEKSAVSPVAITDARMEPMEIIENPEPGAIPATPKLNS